jgi:hypothetical protein
MKVKHQPKAQTLLSFPDFQICPVYTSAEMNMEYWKLVWGFYGGEQFFKDMASCGLTDKH